MNDTERGVVWEEVIILIPRNVNLIFLSATTPNTVEFSAWIGRTKRKVVHVIKTDYRPVPLSHFLWAGTKLQKVLQGNGSFIEKGYTDATNALLPASVTDPIKKKGEQKGRPATGSKQLAWQAQGNKQNWVSLVRFLDRELLTPAVVFSFSKKKCEEIANMLRSLDLNTAKERSAIQAFTLQTVSRLSHNDSQLPQVLTICEMVLRGFGVHHGGLLPILKEMVEILFSRNLIKVLFATETFAMGVNMVNYFRSDFSVTNYLVTDSQLYSCSVYAARQSSCLQFHTKARRISVSCSGAWRVHSDGWPRWA